MEVFASVCFQEAQNYLKNHVKTSIRYYYKQAGCNVLITNLLGHLLLLRATLPQ